MEPLSAIVEIAKMLLAEDEEKTPEILLRRVLELSGAERGFIVVREEGGFAQRFQVQFDPQDRSVEQRRFSRSLVKRVLQTGEPIHSPDISVDERFAGQQSVEWIGPSSVLVAPLRHAGQVYGVVYLEHRGRIDLFGAEMQRFLGEFAELAGLFIRRALERESLRKRNRELERDLFARHDFTGIVTGHPKMLELLQLVAQVAEADVTVLVRGETGTGKELVARALHVNSPRRARPFVTLHCTALPENLLESELFGHVKGAFTGAQSHRAGRIAAADGGTLFLDEIAELPLPVQAKLLRFLQFGEVQRLGSDRTETVDVRIVSATHQDLPSLIKAGKFREDLYFRLKVIELQIPPLRERRGDIPLLLEHFTRQHWRRKGETPRWSREAEQRLLAYDFPGNVREMQHLVERACVLARGPELGVELLPPELVPAAAGASPSALPGGGLALRYEALTNEALKNARDALVAELERTFLGDLMARWEWNVSRAAHESGIHRTHLQRLLARYRDEMPPRPVA